MRHESGVTLLELVFVLALLALLASLALPSGQEAAQRQALRTDRVSMQGLLSLARTEALMREQDVVICASQTLENCLVAAEQGASPWPGVLLFLDRNQDRVFQPEDDLLLRVHSLHPLVQMRWNRQGWITYQPDGTVTGNSNGTLALADVRGQVQHRLVIALSGRVRIESLP
ncbi:GspH/FimT family pseudopilin [Nitrincola tapanii]|uniref:Type II secretion system protein H n=1 Tax=Nitrincola tapanii TaxID=1708751 RepID=A0A5A9W789_9GAMM|nr:GspH/FimT family protein [Nitrincola tapanii]KAA0876657.1 prepilin-type N-terminal cleavage/methylation domain-containing protein [Nitrincola tapanii]